jgi:hydroxyethylthiazole kinase-like sugar kinase family protein
MLGIYSVASEKASKSVRGPASLRTELIDTIYNLTTDEVEKNIKIELI